MRRNINCGFTLVELLAVIATTMLLATILFPIFAQARDKNARSVCLSNLKQIGAADSMYLEDWDDTFPMAWGASGAWMTALSPYVAKSSWCLDGIVRRPNTIWHCPADESFPSRDNFLSYATNGLLTGSGFDPMMSSWNIFGYHSSRQLVSIDSPESVVFAGDMVPGYDLKGHAVNYETDWCTPSQDIGSHPADDSDAAVKYYQGWLRVDMTDKKPGFDACPPAIAINWTTAKSCKMIAWRHYRTIQNSGFASFVFVDGHTKAIPFGFARPHNFFPKLTDSQIAAYDNG